MELEETTQWNRRNTRLEATRCGLSGSTFIDVNLSNCRLDNVNFSGASIHNANLSGWRVDDANFRGLQVSNADLSGAAISHCMTEGMTIDGIPVADLMAAYRAARP